MFDTLFSRLDVINFTLVILAAIIFFIGYTLAPTIYFHKIKFLLAYPMWLNNKLEKWIEDKKLSMLAFAVMFILNTIFLALALLSGFVPFLPFILLLWMGINIGVLTYHTLKGDFYYSYLLTPIVLLELAAIFITFTMAINLNLYRLDISSIADYIKPVSDMSSYWDTFGIIVLPLLMLAGFIEVFLIRLSKKFTDDDDQQ
jgi:hypothetical protein